MDFPRFRGRVHHHIGVLDRYLHAVTLADLDTIMELYGPEPVMMRIDQVARGREAVEAWWREYLASLGKVVTFSVEQSEEAEDLVLLEAVLHTSFGAADLVEVMTLADGLIDHHVTSVTAMHLKEEPA
ncbi:MAG: nuclear transport factor 2 family protein [Acidimicrobiia bacterium]|nr:nuclear transport factor 2 family protein [Acidimicrobiia bacterium]NNL28755.1 nuclear transport factor 2 family protein [Acidimicrobiia bacterium]